MDTSHPKHLNFNSMKGKMNEARVVDFSGMGRKEGVNRVSKLSKPSAYFCVAPIRALSQIGQLKRQAISVARHTISCCGK